MIRNWLFLLLAALLLLVPRPAAAHGYIVRSIPEDRSTLERAPVRVSYWFSENLEPDFSTITIRDAEGNVVASGGVPSDDLSLLTARMPTDLPDGAYVAELRVAFASDGHVIYESRVFFVGAEVAGVSSSAASTAAIPLEVAWRSLVLTSFMLLFGAFTLYSGVLIPAWRNPQHRAGWLPPRVMRRLNAIVIVALVGAFAGNIIALLQQAMVFFNADLSRVLSDSLWGVVRIGTRFGDVWNARMFLLALIAALFGLSLYLRERQPETVRPFWVANTWVSALLLGSLSVVSHAAGSPLWPWAGVFNDWAHTLAVGFWAGGLLALVLVLPPALAPYEGDVRRRALVAVLNRFSPLAFASVVVIVATGIFSTVLWIRTPGQVTTSYAGTLAAKLVLVALLLAVGGVHFAALHPERFARWSSWLQRAQAFLPTLRLEAVFVVLVLVAAALLSATPVPTPDFAEQSAPPPTLSQTMGDLTVTAAISPGGPGVNSYDILITRDGQAVDNLDVHVQMVSPARDWRGDWLPAEPAGDGLYVSTGDDINREGGWWMLVSVEGQRFAFDWNIEQDPALLATLTPGILNVLALVVVLVALGYAAAPRVRRFYARLDLRPATVAVAVGSIVATVGIVILALWGMAESQAQYEAQLNPIPKVVNTVLPDADSLARGGALYAEYCAAWEAERGALNNLLRAMSRLRDEDLYSVVQSGGRELPACDAALTDAERWHIVNYLRTLG